jgi:hypothetical protein
MHLISAKKPQLMKLTFLITSGFDVDGLYADVAGSPFDPAAYEFAIVGKKK